MMTRIAVYSTFFFCFVGSMITLHADEGLGFLRVVAYQGEIRYKKGIGERIETLTKGGANFSKGSKVKMGKGDRLELLSPAGDKILVTGKGYFKIESCNFSEKQTRLQLNVFLGKIHCDVNKLSKGSLFSVKTPSTRLEVMGTSFTADVKENGSTDVSVSEGSVSMQNGNQNVTLAEGQSANANSNGSVSVTDSSTSNTTTNQTQNQQNADGVVQGELQQQRDTQSAETLYKLFLKVNDID